MASCLNSISGRFRSESEHKHIKTVGPSKWVKKYKAQSSLTARSSPSVHQWDVMGMHLFIFKFIFYVAIGGGGAMVSVRNVQW